MRAMILPWLASVLVLAPAQKPTTKPAPPPAAAPSLTMAEVLDKATPEDYRPVDPEDLLYLDLPAGRVAIELAPTFAPRHVANIRALVRERYFDGLAILRAQDNYVVQWGDPDGKRELRGAAKTLAAELARPAAELAFTKLDERDAYAPEVGFVAGFPAARDPDSGRAWLTHCYGMVGVGRDDDPASGGGTELYVVIGHAPRHLDRNVTLVGRVLAGIELLSTLPRGKGALGFYDKAGERTPIRAMRVAADLPLAERTNYEVLRTDTKTFAALVAARKHRKESWFIEPTGRIELCNVPLVARVRP